MKKTQLYGLMMLVIACFNACKPGNEPSSPGEINAEKSIIILYDNDVHCGVDGYTAIAGLRNAINQSDTAECIIVSSGDFLQGGNWGALSSGSYIVDLMNAVGYSAVTIGNHEFDYGGPQMLNLLSRLHAPKTCVNFSAYGSTEQYFQPYVMQSVAGKKIAFVGVVTPATLKMEYYSFYDKDGAQLYDLYPNNYQTLTQQAVDAARAAGADYVFLLSHLGEQDNGYSSIQMIQNTYGIDRVLDGHTHSVITDSTATNAQGQTIHFTQTGTQFANIGKLTISRTGAMSTELLPIASVTYTDNHVDAVYDSINTLISAVENTKVGTTDHALTINDRDGNRIVRSQECTAGNFVADALRYCTQAEIGLVNGGGVRADIPAGDITYGTLVNVSPFFNDLEARQLTGEQIRSLLEMAYNTQSTGEGGSFLQVSGLRVTIRTQDGYRVLSEVQVADADGRYQALYNARTYTVGSSSYVFGLQAALADCPVVTPVIMKDTEALRVYLEEGLKGDIGSLYTTTEDRIIIQ